MSPGVILVAMDDQTVETDEQVIRRELDESGVDGERALAVLVGTLVARHMDCALRQGSRGPARGPGQERPNALVAAMDALFQHSRGPGALGQTFDSAPRADLAPDDAINVRRMLMRVLSRCQFLAEGQTIMDGDDDDDGRPRMRIVRD